MHQTAGISGTTQGSSVTTDGTGEKEGLSRVHLLANYQWPLTAGLNHFQGCETVRPQIRSTLCPIEHSAGQSACLTGPPFDTTNVSDCVMVFEQKLHLNVLSFISA